MPKARISSKGQVTIPAAVRRALGAATGDELVFEVHEDRAVFVVAKREPLTALRGVLPASRAFEGRDAARDAAGDSLGRSLADRTKRRG